MFVPTRSSCAPRAATCPSSQHDHFVGQGNRRESVGDDDRRPASHRLAQTVADPCLRRGIHGRGRVVQDQDARVDDERTRDRDPLALAARECDAALADHGVVSVRERRDEVVRLREARRTFDLLVGRLRAAEGDVLADGRGEEERVLRDHADLTAQRCECHLAHVDTVDRHRARLDVVEARHERRQGGLARAGVPDQRDDPACLELEVDRAAARAARGRSRTSRGRRSRGQGQGQLRAPGCVADLLRLVDHLEDALAGRRRALSLADPHAECAQRHHEHRQVEVEADEAADRQRAVRDHSPADVEDAACETSGRKLSIGT